MDYRINPAGGIWQGGMFFVPVQLADKYLKLASEYQIKALLYILSKNGVATSAELSKKLGIPAADAENMMDFWLEEGVLLSGSESGNSIPAAGIVPAPAPPKAEKPQDLPYPESTVQTESAPETQRRVKSPAVKAPSLSPKEIVAIGSQKPQVARLLGEAQKIYGRTISHSEQEMIVNLTEFYGMPAEVVMMLLAYCENLRVNGRAVSAGYFYKTAQNWLEEGIDTPALAESRICELEKTDAFWQSLKDAAGFTRKAPTDKQAEMILRWRSDFSDEMILRAAGIMNENIDKPDFRYMDKILKNWKTAGIKTIEDVARANESFEKKKAQKEKSRRGEISRKPTYDLDKIKKDALNNTDIKY